MRPIVILVLALTVSSCKCGGGTISSRFGELVIVQRGTTGREVFLHEATVTLPPTFMETLGVSEVQVRNVGLEEMVILAVTRLEGDESLSLADAAGMAIAPENDAALPVRFSPPQAANASLPDFTHRAKLSAFAGSNLNSARLRSPSFTSLL